MNELPLPANTMLPVELKLYVWLGLVKAIRIVYVLSIYPTVRPFQLL